MKKHDKLAIVGSVGGLLLGQVVEELAEPGNPDFIVLDPVYEIIVLSNVHPQTGKLTQTRMIVPYQGQVDSTRVRVSGTFTVCYLNESDAHEFQKPIENAEQSRQQAKAKRSNLVIPGITRQ